MPFDGTQLRVANNLAALGITPVARAAAEAHKAKMLEQFVAESGYNELMVARKVARWITIPILLDELAKPPKYSTERHRAPTEIVNLARVVEENIPNAKFELEYFYTDPILNVYYLDGGVPHYECLGIWDQGRVVAIADDAKASTRPVPWTFGYLELALTCIAVVSFIAMV